MELRHLRYFVAVAEELHFGRAARRLHLAQPPLSQQIRALEEDLGVRLFARTSRRVDLTAEGRVFLDHARRVLAQAREAEAAVKSAGRGEIGRLAVGYVTSAAYTIMPAILKQFHSERPAVELRCVEMSGARQLPALRQREIDVGLLRTSAVDDALELITLLREPLVLAVPAGHPLATAPNPVLRAAAKEPFIVVPATQSPGFHEAVFKSCRRAGFVPRVAQEATEGQTILALVAAGLGVALVPAALMMWRRPGVAFRDLAGESVHFDLLLARRKDDRSALADHFVAIARATAIRTQLRAV